MLKAYIYGKEIIKYTAKGAVIGIAGKIGYDLYNESAKVTHIVFQKTASIDEKVGEAIVENGGKAGETAIKVDKWQGDFWSKVFGRTPEKQAEWRKKHGINEPGYIEKNAEKKELTTEVIQPVSITYEKPLPAYGGNLFLTVTLILGITGGFLKGRYLHRKEARERELEESVKELKEMIEEGEEDEN